MTDEEKTRLSPQAEAFLRASGRGFLVTLRPDGSPTVHPMTALFSRGQLVYNTYRKSVKARNAARDPRTCSLLVSDYDEAPERALVYKGRAQALDPAELEPARVAPTRPARALDSSIPDRANARLEEGKRVLLGVEPEVVRLLGPDGGS